MRGDAAAEGGAWERRVPATGMPEQRTDAHGPGRTAPENQSQSQQYKVPENQSRSQQYREPERHGPGRVRPQSQGPESPGPQRGGPESGGPERSGTGGVIELDLDSPWEPPEPPEPPVGRSWISRRMIAACLVLLVVAGALVSAQPTAEAGVRMLYQIDRAALGAAVIGDRVFATRYQADTPALLEVRNMHSGQLLWSRPLGLAEQFAVLGDRVPVVIHDGRNGSGPTSATVLDAATGAERWARNRVQFIGVAGEALLAVEADDSPADTTVFNDDDVMVNRAGAEQPERLMALDERTGAVVWDFTAPARSALAIGWTDRQYRFVGSFQELSDSGLLSTHDPRTGKVVATRQLAGSGRVAWFVTGSEWGGGGATEHQVAVYSDGQRGADIYDLDSGRLRFRWAVDRVSGLQACAPEVYCVTLRSGMQGLDAVTGRVLWQLDGYSDVLDVKAGRLLVATAESGEGTTDTAVIDVRSGRVIRHLAGWQRIPWVSSSRPLLWHADGSRGGVVAEFDPAGDGFAVVARADGWFGVPTCGSYADMMTCVGSGALSVWRLPPRS